MTRETQIGLTLVLILSGVFGFFVYKKINNPTAAVAAANPDDQDDSAKPPAPETPPATEPASPATGSQQPLIAASNDRINVKPATASRVLPDSPVAAAPRIPVEPKAQPTPDDDVFGAPAATTVTTPAARPKLPTSIPDDESDPFGAPVQPAKPISIASRSPSVMEVTSATVPDESEDPFGAPPQREEPAGSEPDPFGGAAVASTGSPSESDDPFGAPSPAARPKLPTVTDDAFSDPPQQPAESEADPFGAPANPVAMESPVSDDPPASRTADDELGFGAAPAATSEPEPANPVRLSLPVAEETESDPFGAAEPKTASAPPATLGEPEFDSAPVARPAPMLNPPATFAAEDQDAFEPPVKLQQPEPVELTRNSAEEENPFGAAAAESTTDVRRSEPATSTISQETDEPEFAPPRRTLEPQPSSIGGPLPRPAPTLPLEETPELPAARPAPAPRPVAIDLPKPGPITAEQHSVEPNQNFWTLSQRRYGTGRYSEALAAHNKEKVPDPTAIRLGTVVSLPAAQILEQQYPDLISKLAEPQVDPRSVVAGPEQYVIQDGDSFWKISKKVYGDPRYWDALQKHNSETAKLPTLKPGTIISTPPVGVLDQKFASLITPPAAKPTTPAGVGLPEAADDAAPGLFAAADGQPLYRVGNGDNLSGIARATLGRSSRWVQILHLNRETLKDGNDLTPGTVLRMPADATQVQMSSLERDRR